MDLKIQGSGALVTGASAGIGRAVARALAAEGARVAMVARRANLLASAADEIEAEVGARPWTVAADMSHPARCRQVVDEVAEVIDGISILVNCIPAPIFGSFADLSDESWEAAMLLKFHTYVRTSRAAMPHLAKSGNGVIVNVIGVGGKAPSRNHLPTHAANAAVMLLTTGLAKELSEQRIRVVGVSPGGTLTEGLRNVTRLLADSRDGVTSDLEHELLAATPTGRLALPADIADVVVFLASGRARQINGTTITVDGGAAQTP